MPVTLAYITEHHAIWKERIALAGVWDVAKFTEVTLRVRPAARTLNGQFKRRITRSRNPLGKATVEDTLTIYDNPWLDTRMKIDSVLVHEMIHQYIYQARLRDTSSHGPVFMGMMNRINRLFPDQLHLTVSVRAPREQMVPRRKADFHVIAVVVQGPCVYCCRVAKSAAPQMVKILRRLEQTAQISSWDLYYSTDPYFDSMSACRTRLHGLRITPAELPGFITTHALQPLKNG